MRPQVGQVINNKYRLLRLIGDGGMGSVFEARHEVLGTTVALKFLHPELGRRAGLVQRFLQEAKVSAQIQSPHVVRVSDVDQTSAGLAFIVMEYIEGKTLQALYEELYRAGQRLSYADALGYAMQMLEGVDAAHHAGVVHRDLKPDNVMITKGPKGEPLLKLLDFGIAKLKVSGELDRGLTRPGVVMGTPEYMAPEQAFSADAVDARADVFSLGVMIFEMLAGRRPVGGDEPHQIAAQYLAGRVARLTELAPWVPAELAAVVHKAMGAKPQDRLGSIAELREAIEPFAREATSPSLRAATPPGAGPGPATNALGKAGGESRVPKTWPPDERPAGGEASARNTPPGGFAAAAGAGAFATTDGAGRGGPSGGAMAGTVAAGPIVAGTMAAGPVGSGTVAAGPVAEGPRVGGTAIGAPPFVEGAPGRTGLGGPAFPGTAPMTPLEASAVATPAPRKPARGGSGGLALILALAAGVAGLVVGGVYLAQQYAKVDDHHDDPPVMSAPPPATVASEPPPVAPSGPEPVVTPPPVPTPTPTPKPVTHPGPAPTSPAAAHPGPGPATFPTATQPTTLPPILPSALPPITLPQFPGLPSIFGQMQPGGGQTQPSGGSTGGGTTPGTQQPQPGGGTPSTPPGGRPPITIPPRR
jgi:serine/threonine-protein kinase